MAQRQMHGLSLTPSAPSLAGALSTPPLTAPAETGPRCPGCAASLGAATGTGCGLRRGKEGWAAGACISGLQGLQQKCYATSTHATNRERPLPPPPTRQPPAPPTGVRHVAPRLAPRRRQVRIRAPLLHHVQAAADAVLLARDGQVPRHLCRWVGRRLQDLRVCSGSARRLAAAGWHAWLGLGEREAVRRRVWSGRCVSRCCGGAALTLLLRRSVTNVMASEPSRKPLR